MAHHLSSNSFHSWSRKEEADSFIFLMEATSTFRWKSLKNLLSDLSKEKIKNSRNHTLKTSNYLKNTKFQFPPPNCSRNTSTTLTQLSYFYSFLSLTLTSSLINYFFMIFFIFFLSSFSRNFLQLHLCLHSFERRKCNFLSTLRAILCAVPSQEFFVFFASYRSFTFIWLFHMSFIKTDRRKTNYFHVFLGPFDNFMYRSHQCEKVWADKSIKKMNEYSNPKI